MNNASLTDLRIKLFADGADVAGMRALADNPLIAGMTTNPTLMHKVGLRDYETFAREVLEVVRVKPISFEVFSDEPAEMRRQARKIAGWAENVFVKIPITNTLGESCLPLISELSQDGVKLNVTAILTARQVNGVAEALAAGTPAVVSVFAGRVADTGRDPVPLMRDCRKILTASERPQAALLWASVREVLNIFQAEECGCDIVTVTHDILHKAFKMCGQNLEELSLDTVKMFARDAQSAGFTL